MSEEEQCWTAAQAAAHLGVIVDAARKQLSRWKIRGERHYPAAEIIRHHADRPGSGNWIRKCISCGGPGPTADLCDECNDSIEMTEWRE